MEGLPDHHSRQFKTKITFFTIFWLKDSYFLLEFQDNKHAKKIDKLTLWTVAQTTTESVSSIISFVSSLYRGEVQADTWHLNFEQPQWTFENEHNLNQKT